eukprot:5294685-Pyramimonas_sp.AAC.1
MPLPRGLQNTSRCTPKIAPRRLKRSQGWFRDGQRRPQGGPCRLQNGLRGPQADSKIVPRRGARTDISSHQPRVAVTLK